MSIEHERMREDGQTSAEADQHEIEQAYNMTPNQAEAERVARELAYQLLCDHVYRESKSIWTPGMKEDDLKTAITAAILAAEERGRQKASLEWKERYDRVAALFADTQKELSLYASED